MPIEFQGDLQGRRCVRSVLEGQRGQTCDGLMDAIERTTGGAFTVYKCRTCGREIVVDSFDVEVK